MNKNKSKSVRADGSDRAKMSAEELDVREWLEALEERIARLERVVSHLFTKVHGCATQGDL